MKNKFAVDIQVTGRCNMACDFCCGAIKYTSDEDAGTIKSAIDKIKSVGATTVVFSGGEPLVRDDIAEVLGYAHKQGLVTYLSTNGLLLFKKYESFKDSIDCLGLPIDGSSAEMNAMVGRDQRMFDNNLEILRYFKKNPPKHSVKIGTLVSKVNMNDIPNIARLLSENEVYRPDVWRLYQFTPIREGLSSRAKHEISDLDFNRICTEVKGQYPQLNISELSNEDSDNSYLFIDPKMNIQLLIKNEFLNLGNIEKMTTGEIKEIIRKSTDLNARNSMNRRWLYEK